MYFQKKVKVLANSYLYAVVTFKDHQMLVPDDQVHNECSYSFLWEINYSGYGRSVAVTLQILL